ncbi:MAG TPA: oligopeptide/dipeptide ABC transporter ATP-binding protein [bacterium]|nr:oligopeptide/dipeptide ABC transporter ATP-binding protein [bacterium]
MLLSVRKIIKEFPVQRGLLGTPTAFLKAVNDVSFEVEAGEVVGVVGESGCGKSTVGKCIVGLYEPTAGQIFWNDKDAVLLKKDEKRDLRREFQMVFQNPFSSLNPRQKIKDVLLEPLEVHGLFEPSERLSFVKGLMIKVGLSEADLFKYPHEFSGGQRQRIGIARALACQPSMIVLDEPVSSLDVSVQASILNLLVKLNRDQKISYLFISHDLQVVGYISHRVLVMYLGKVVEEGKVEQVLQNPKHPYTQVLLKASIGASVVLKGEPPNPVNVPQGCPFSARCLHVENRCLSEKQELQEVENRWRVACWKWPKI